MAHVIEVPDKAMLAIDRCDRCGAQAYMEVAEIPTAESSLLFCRHHANMHEDALKAMNVKIADHRPYLAKMESGVGTALTAK